MKKRFFFILSIVLLLGKVYAQQDKDTISYPDGRYYYIPLDTVRANVPPYGYGYQVVVAPGYVGNLQYKVIQPLRIYGIAVTPTTSTNGPVFLRAIGGDTLRYEPDPPDVDSSTLDLYAVLIQKEDSQFVHVDSVKWHRRSPDKYFRYTTTYTDTVAMGLIQDTVVPVYEFFFDTPHFVHDSFYVGFRSDYVRSPNFDPAISVYEHYPQQWAWELQGMAVQVPSNPPSENFSETYFQTWYNEGWAVNRFGQRPLVRFPPFWGGIFPIIVPPDTDAVVGIPVWGFHRGEDYEGYPVFEWTQTEGQELYEVAYGRADQDPHDYRVVQTTYPWLILRDSTLDSTVVYAAQCRSRRHHACAIHDTLVWSAWTDTVEFYTGRYRPGSAPTEGIAEAVGGTVFTLSPNPAKDGVRLEVAAEGFRGGVLAVADAAGREVLRRELKASERVCEFRVADLPAGTYFVTLATKDGTSTRKLVVE